MPRTLTADETTLARIAGLETFVRGRKYADDGAVLDVQGPADRSHLFGEVLGSRRQPYSSVAFLTWSTDGSLKSFRGSCTCPVSVDCKHSVALVLESFADAPGPEPATVTPLRAPWENSLLGLVDGDGADPGEEDAPAVALQFDLTVPGETAGRRGLTPTLSMRPVVPRRGGGWVRSGISWSDVGRAYRSPQIPKEQVRVLQDIAGLERGGAPSYYGYGSPSAPISLDAFPSPHVWDLLREAVALGIPLVGTGVRPAPVVLTSEPAELTVDLTRVAPALSLRPHLASDGESIPFDSSVFLGSDTAHGVAWWRSGSETTAGLLRLARLSTPVSGAVRAFVRQPELRIPEAQAERFFSRYLPALRDRVRLRSVDGSVEIPEPAPPVLQLTVTHHPGHEIDLLWQWRYTLGSTTRLEPFRPANRAARGRDLDAETQVLEDVVPPLKGMVELWETRVGGDVGEVMTVHGGAGEHRLRAAAALHGMAVVGFATEILPQLEQVQDLVVEVVGEPADYREASEAPVVEIDGEPASEGRDWFDLAVTVTVDGEAVPFEMLFTALAAGQSQLILPSGTWFTLDRPEFRMLADLIAEARALQDHERGTVRLSRYQASFWEELERIGVVGGQAAEWQRQVRSLVDVDAMVEPPLPAGLHAELRPYQRTGFTWLSFLYRHGLGGVLADEMGLGKTLQALALICSAKETRRPEAPFVIVAPTSVVTNWAAECRRFTPDLVVRVITETKARRRRELAEIAAGADVVLTSYTLFRLENEDYQALEWAGLILDEAQFVKNHQSKAYASARSLATPFKLAITGTPMENNLMELWSLLSITAPGLFASPVRFEKSYRTPIEKDRNVELLDRLRRRVKPLMLRRSKDEVVRDLPAKQEQVLELPLNPKHRKVYATHLQRERQKVLGLLGDLEKNRFEIFRSLTLLRQASLDAALIDPKYAGIPSTKLDHLAEQLVEIADDGHRVLVFSQFTRFLDAARARAEAAGLAYCYLDGKTKNRAATIEAFKSGTAPVFFISLKAGGFGLNLTEADYCILLDPWWNPATEAQAVDRVHRIGQRKQVMVYRLVAQETIEEKVMALKAAKSALFDSVMDGGEFSTGALSADDIRGMLG